MSVYVSNSSGCACYEGSEATVASPCSALATYNTALSGTDLTNVSTDDDNADMITGLAGYIVGHRMQVDITEDPASISKITLTTKGTAVYTTGLCLVGESNILCIDGERRIDSIKVGDFVISADHNTFEIFPRKVTHVHKEPISKYGNKLYCIKLSSGKTIHCTYNHVFFVNGVYISAESLRTGVALKSDKFTDVIIESIGVYDKKDIYVYDLTVENEHNLFVEGVLSHNKLVNNYNQQLYVWNDTGSSWGSALAYHIQSAKTTLTYSLTSSIADYIDGDGLLHYMCCVALSGQGATDTLYYAQAEVFTTTIKRVAQVADASIKKVSQVVRASVKKVAGVS